MATFLYKYFSNPDELDGDVSIDGTIKHELLSKTLRYSYPHLIKMGDEWLEQGVEAWLDNNGKVVVWVDSDNCLVQHQSQTGPYTDRITND